MYISFMQSIEKWLNILGVHTARFLEYVRSFFNIMYENVILVEISMLFQYKPSWILCFILCFQLLGDKKDSKY